MSMRTTLIAMLFVPGAGWSATIQTPPAPGGVGSDLNLFIELDQDKDGVVTKAEAERSATVKGEFDAIDRDGNGKISREEWVRFFSGKGSGKR